MDNNQCCEQWVSVSLNERSLLKGNTGRLKKCMIANSKKVKSNMARPKEVSHGWKKIVETNVVSVKYCKLKAVRKKELLKEKKEIWKVARIEKGRKKTNHVSSSK